ncbi:hypothetical protein BDD21_1404 [Thiocapsa rosea]|uniref:Uncharacterized protein n=1 Tax=Thiocapsa rosea TaxID=69360 RepID=A0A495V5Z8_9GAMM|nr:hypothetical protein BDD21_1404 [Thiocapsa rosea]
MSGPVSKVGLGTSSKLIGLTKHAKHRHVPSPISLHFVAPPAQLMQYHIGGSSTR